MKRRTVGALCALFGTLLLTSCTTLRQQGGVPYRYFQHMALPGTIVVTMDAEQEPEFVETAFSSMEEFAHRTDRISLALTGSADVYPLTGDDISADVVVEGDFPRVVVNTALQYASDFRRNEAEDGTIWFSQKDGPLSMYSEHNGTLFVTDGRYPEARALLENPEETIDGETAAMMERAAIAVYAFRPETFFDLDLGLSQSVLSQMQSLLLLVHRNGDGHTMDAVISMDTPKLADTLSKLVRTGYLAKLRREKTPFSLSSLIQMFSVEGSVLTVRDMQVTERQLQTLRQSLIGLL